MENFLKAIPAAASSAYALVAYFMCIVAFLFAGSRLRKIRAIVSQIESIPAGKRKEVIEIATETKLPDTITAEEWIRLNRIRWITLIIVMVILAATVVGVIALTRSRVDSAKLEAQLTQVGKEINQKVDETNTNVTQTGEKVSGEIKSSEEKIISSVEKSALATLETMFPLTARIDRDVDSTIMHLDGRPRQRIVSYDKEYSPMKLHWGDRFHYFIYSERNMEIPPDLSLSLELIAVGRSTILPLKVDSYRENEIRIPGSSPQPIEAYLINPNRIRDIAIKITIYSSDRERARETFKESLMSTSLASRAREVYKQISGNGIALYSEPTQDSTRLRSIQNKTYVKVLESQEGWAKVRLPEGRSGWVKSNYIKPIS